MCQEIRQTESTFSGMDTKQFTKVLYIVVTLLPGYCLSGNGLRKVFNLEKFS